MTGDPELDTLESNNDAKQAEFGASSRVTVTQLEPVKSSSTGDLEGKKPAEAQGEKAHDEIERRHRLGYYSAAFGALVISGTLIWSIYSVNWPIANFFDARMEIDSAKERVIFATIGAHAIITVAAVYFGYTMLRLSERMFLPRHLLHDESTVGVVKALLGVSTPAKAAADGAKQAAESLATVLKPLVELTKPILEAIRGVADKK
jgi:hypothetical protein